MSIKCYKKMKNEKRSKYLYTITTSNCINNKITTLLCLSNSLVRQRHHEIIIINNNKIHSSELISIRVNEISIIKLMLKKRS